MVRGQDSEYFSRCVRRGLRIAYEPAAVAHHQIGPERLSVQAFRRWRHRQGYYEAMLLPWKPSHVVTIMPQATVNSPTVGARYIPMAAASGDRATTRFHSGDDTTSTNSVTSFMLRRSART